MTPDFHSSAIYKDTGFEAVLDNVCGRLVNKQLEFSIRRLQEMETRLGILEQELDAFIIGKAGDTAGPSPEGVSEPAVAPVSRNAE
jgi:hypothetical protein